MVYGPGAELGVEHFGSDTLQVIGCRGPKVKDVITCCVVAHLHDSDPGTQECTFYGSTQPTGTTTYHQNLMRVKINKIKNVLDYLVLLDTFMTNFHI